MNIPNILPGSSKDAPSDDTPSTGVDGLSISDVIGKERIISIFAGFTRDIDSISKRLNDQGQNTTVLAPSNAALQKLPRKPWEDLKDYSELGANAYDGQSGEDRATRNMRRFSEAHIIRCLLGRKVKRSSRWAEGRFGGRAKTGSKWYVFTIAMIRAMRDADHAQVQPGNIEVSSIANKVSNGEVWVLRGSLNYE